MDRENHGDQILANLLEAYELALKFGDEGM